MCEAVVREEVDSHHAIHIFDPRVYKQENSSPQAHHAVTEPIKKTPDIYELRRRLEEKMRIAEISHRSYEDNQKWQSFHSTTEQSYGAQSCREST